MIPMTPAKISNTLPVLTTDSFAINTSDRVKKLLAYIVDYA